MRSTLANLWCQCTKILVMLIDFRKSVVLVHKELKMFD